MFLRLIGFVIFPADDLVATSTADIANDVASRCHVPLDRQGFDDVDDSGEKVCLSVLASEVPTDDILVVREVRFAVLAHVDARRGEVNVVGETHRCLRPPTSLLRVGYWGGGAGGAEYSWYSCADSFAGRGSERGLDRTEATRSSELYNSEGAKSVALQKVVDR